MQIIELTPAEIAKVFKEHLKRDFPHDEIKPLFVINGHIKNHDYQAFGLFKAQSSSDTPGATDGRTDLADLLAYAFLFGKTTGSLLLLDYFAVIPEARQQGVGSRFLELLSQNISQSAGLAAEVESIEAAPDEKDRHSRQRRLDFYLACGFRSTNIKGNIFGVDYDIVFRPPGSDWDDKTVHCEMEKLYSNMMSKMMYKRNIKITERAR